MPATVMTATAETIAAATTAVTTTATAATIVATTTTAARDTGRASTKRGAPLPDAKRCGLASLARTASHSRRPVADRVAAAPDPAQPVPCVLRDEKLVRCVVQPTLSHGRNARGDVMQRRSPARRTRRSLLPRPSSPRSATLVSLDAETAALRELRESLSRNPREIPCKYFYDDAGSDLFEKITGLEEYYPTRTERALLEARAPAIVASATMAGARASRSARSVRVG